MVIKYINSAGREIDFLKPPYHATETDFFDWEKSGNRNGCKKKIKIDVIDDIEHKLDELYEIIGVDSEIGVYGRLFVNNTYLLCNLKASKKKKWKGFNMAEVELTFEAPELIWHQDFKKEFYKEETAPMTVTEEGLDFPFDFPFDFAKDKTSSENWIINTIMPSNFKLIVYGPCINPQIMINKHPYLVHVELSAGEYLVIDSVNSFIYKVKVDGSKENCFHKRDLEYSVFQKLPPGNNEIIWNHEFGFALHALVERSEPRWLS